MGGGKTLGFTLGPNYKSRVVNKPRGKKQDGECLFQKQMINLIVPLWLHVFDQDKCMMNERVNEWRNDSMNARRHVCARTDGCPYACVNVWHACMHVCMRVYARVCIYACMHACTHSCTYVCSYHVRMCRNTCTHLHGVLLQLCLCFSHVGDHLFVYSCM